MARFLMMPHAPGGTLAHLAACSAVAAELRERGHEAIFTYGGSRPELLEDAGFEWHPVVEAGGPMYWEWFESAEHLERIVSSRLELIGRLRPAACVTSAGFGGIAAEVNGLPELTLMHGLSGTRSGRAAVRAWMLRDAARHPTRLLGHLRARRHRPERDRAIAIIAEVRRRRGLPPLDTPDGLTGRADLVACTTAPFLDPTRRLPARWRYVGPLSYGGDGAAAEPAAIDGARVHVSQGSTGSAKLLRDAVAELSGEGWQVAVSTGGLCEPRELRELGSDVVAGSILDTRSELEAADLAVIAGGQMTAMEALLAGTPTVMVPHTRQQAAGALRAERLGTGIALWPRVRRGAVGRAASRILRDGSYARRAGEIAARLSAGWDGNARAATLAESLVDPQSASEGAPLSGAR
jgi:UDP:flavonoid glycosyltransferase YjiC (YdhE family)